MRNYKNKFYLFVCFFALFVGTASADFVLCEAKHEPDPRTGNQPGIMIAWEEVPGNSTKNIRLTNLRDIQIPLVGVRKGERLDGKHVIYWKGVDSSGDARFNIYGGGSMIITDYIRGFQRDPPSSGTMIFNEEDGTPMRLASDGRMLCFRDKNLSKIMLLLGFQHGLYDPANDTYRDQILEEELEDIKKCCSKKCVKDTCTGTCKYIKDSCAVS